MKKTKNVLIILFSVVILAGCKTATYDTAYKFSEPTTSAGLKCVSTCQRSRDLCLLHCEGIQCDCNYEHRSCYQLCGGTVSSENICVANCPKVV